MSDRLHNALARLREQSARAEPSAELEAALLAEFGRTHRRRRMVSWAWQSAAVAAAVIALVFAGFDRRPPGEVQAGDLVDPIQESPTAEQPFVAIPYVAPISPYEQASVVRMDLPVAALIAAGLPMQTRDPSARVEADVLVGQDGQPRAVRVVAVANFSVR
jgi:hypothetical protein